MIKFNGDSGLKGPKYRIDFFCIFCKYLPCRVTVKRFTSSHIAFFSKQHFCTWGEGGGGP